MSTTALAPAAAVWAASRRYASAGAPGGRLPARTTTAPAGSSASASASATSTIGQSSGRSVTPASYSSVSVPAASSRIERQVRVSESTWTACSGMPAAARASRYHAPA